jgi:hypothetical protein
MPGGRTMGLPAGHAGFACVEGCRGHEEGERERADLFIFFALFASILYGNGGRERES